MKRHRALVKKEADKYAKAALQKSADNMEKSKQVALLTDIFKKYVACALYSVTIFL